MSAATGFFESVLRESFNVAVASAQPSHELPGLWAEKIQPWLDSMAPERQRVWVIGAGKAAASMVQAVEACAGQHEHLTGMVITRRGHGGTTQHVEVLEAAHPVPDEEGQRASRRLLQLLRTIEATDPVIALVSGGGSSLLSVPVKDIPFVDLQQLNRALLTCGAPIDEMNTVRKHVTQTLGGQLAQACRAPVFQLMISDVPGDDPAVVASGPFCADDTTYQDALNVIRRWNVQAPHSVLRHLEKGCKGLVPETPKSSSLVFRKIRSHIMASNGKMLDAVEHYLRQQGYTVLSFGDTVEGESSHVAKVHAALVKQAMQGRGGWPAAPLAILSGGECAVTLSDTQMKQAKGGRNSEFLLSLVHELRAQPEVFPLAALAADTDGIDGVGGHAGALLLPGDLTRIQQLQLSARLHLEQHTSHDFFHTLGRLLVTGPTQTNVNDLRLILIGQP
ncbi:glycerate kinase [Limnobacter humi]|uniref:Glycerate kinase n=1 Tax=Limnobacter humi TaxID=1778671 RepID=A0ABT1WHT9_9BURK|nr:glycerate kinase [Limnobacter humi]MCQ8897085.1 glycerate kinase [Limnobacter humi]